jgi:hypothetical protein
LESSSCFLPSAGIDPCDELIQLSPSSCSGDFLVNGVGRMIGSMLRRRQFIEKHLGQRASRTEPESNWANATRPPGPGPFLVSLGPSSSPWLIFTFWSSRMKSELYVLILGDDPS